MTIGFTIREQYESELIEVEKGISTLNQCKYIEAQYLEILAYIRVLKDATVDMVMPRQPNWLGGEI